ncbi:MAG: tripartite tricarboxylate transporter permease [Planctomycetales bacterium]|nr:tripartite tricarboxylate transporter permease [Planctomycetales bacterium]
MSEWLTSIQIVAAPASLSMMMLGTALGIIVGAIPGLSGAMLIALSLPLTFAMQPVHALILLVSMYVGSVSGGLVSATLLRIPGTPAAMMTTYDGYPMAQAGHAHRALGLGAFASLVGGIIGWIFLVLLAQPLAWLSLKFGPFEFLALILLAMVLIAIASGNSLSKGFLAGSLGILAAMPGTDATGQLRWTFGVNELDDGFKLLPVLIGLFAINQIMSQILTDSAKPAAIKVEGGLLLKGSHYVRQGVNLVRSSLIGVFVGILPGVGANIGSVVAYTAAKSLSQTPQRFGQGCDDGIVASEAANNATVGGALIPLVSMGIPGSVIDAILLGALTIHGLQPGPMLMEQNPEVVHVIMATLLLSNVFMFAFMLATSRLLSRLGNLSLSLLAPVVVSLCFVGTYALANRMFDVWVMLAFGLLGFAMDRWRLPLAPFVIGFVLAPLAEEHLTEGLMQSGGSWWPIVLRPLSATFLVLAVVLLAWTVNRHRSTVIEAG